MKDIGTKNYQNGHETQTRKKLVDLMKNSPIPDDQKLENLGLFLNSKNLSRVLFMDSLYRKQIDNQGVIFDFGTRWGNNASIFAACRGIYEPFNRHKKIVAFDTFSGFPSVHEKDGSSDMMREGCVTVTENYDDYLNQILDCQEQDAPLNHIKKYEIIKGDAVEKIEQYLNENPETIISLAYFDFDIYEPTKKCLDLIKPRLTKGSIIGFDELNDHDSPGETIALMESFGLNNIRLKRHRYTSRVSYFEVE